jgi:hypothetical protein
MDRRQDIDALLAWDTGGPLPAEGFARVAAHPRLAEASRAMASNMLAAAAADPRLDGIFKDAGRYTATTWAMWLHGSGELTLQRLKEASVSSGFLSSGRARDLLNYLIHLEFIEQATPAGIGTPARFALTPAFVESWRSHYRAALQAASVIEPGVSCVLGALAEPDVFDAFARSHSDVLLQASSSVAQEHPYVRIFLHRHAGNQIVWTLLLAEGAEFPSREPIQVAIPALASRFGVSRLHLKRVFDEAEQEGLVRRETSGAVTLQDSFCDYVRGTYAGQLLLLLIAAARTARTAPQLVS